MAPREKKEDLLIINRRTGKALQATGADNGMVVEQAAITGEDAQLWTPVKVGKDIKLLNKHSGKVLDVMQGSTEAGSWIQVWEDAADGESQLWQLVKITATYSKLLNVRSGKVLDIVDMREDDGAPAQIWDDVDGAGQQWKLAAPKTIKALAAKFAAEETPEKAPKRTTRKPKAAAEEKAGPAPKKRATRKAKTEDAAPAPKKRGRKPAKSEE